MQPARLKIEQGLVWAFLALLLAGCMLIMRPFSSALLWAVILSFSLWPLHRRLVRLLGQRRTLAATIMASALFLVILLPFVIAGVTLADNVQELKSTIRRWIDSGPPEPPAWLVKVPVVGQTATKEWQELAADSSKLLEQAKRFLEPASLWLLKSGFALSKGLLELALSILITFFFLRDGVSLTERLKAAVERIGGERGRHLLEVAGGTVRGVVYGILGTALLQAVLTGFGLFVSGVPGVPLLVLLTFVLCLLPAVGATLVWLPAALWLFHQGSPGRAIFLFIWGIGVSSADNFVKPWLISQGSKMPFVLIFFGVLGGAVAFGFIGLFIGPTLLAVGFKLIEEWLAKAASDSTSQTAPVNLAYHD
jgi:predicted PurR-regulated permease PerM